MLEYLPALLILVGLGAMAYFMTKSGKETNTKRKAAADEKGWQYKGGQSPVVYNIPDEDRNISYQLSGITKQGVKWEVVCRHLKTIDKGGNLKVELQPSTIFDADYSCEFPFLIIPNDGVNLPGYILAEIFKELNFPVDTPQLEPELLPEVMREKFRVYSTSPDSARLAEKASLHMAIWSNKYAGRRNALIVKGDLNGFKMRTDRGMEKPEDMVFFTELALNLARIC